jgi:hypothetical protein
MKGTNFERKTACNSCYTDANKLLACKEIAKGLGLAPSSL